MAKRISEQITEYLTLGGDGFTPQTSVPLQVQGHTILGTTQKINNNDDYKANLTTINGHLIINSYYNNHNNYSQGIRINKGSDNRTLLMLGGNTDSTEGTSDTTWYIGTFPNSNNSSTTDLIIARNDYQFNNEKPSLQLTNDGLTVYKRVIVDSKTSGSANAGFCLKGGSSAGSDIYSQMYINAVGVEGNSNPGIAVLELGNNKSASTTNNAKGQLRLWGSGNKYSNIETKATANRTAYLPDVSGWLVMGGNGSSTGVGSSNIPIYIKTDGVAATVSNSVLTNLSSTTAGNIYTAEPRPGVTGTLAVTNGGTGQTNFTANRLVYASGSTSIASLQNIYVNSGKMGINTSNLSTNINFEVNGKSLFHNDVSIGGDLDVTYDTHLQGSLLASEEVNLEYKLKTIDSIAQIADTTNNITTSENEYHIYTLAPKQIVTSWNNSNNSKYIEISLPSGINQTTIGFWIDFYSSTGIGSFCCYGEIPASNEEWENCQVFSLGNITITQFPVQFCRHNNQYKIIIGNGTYDIVNNINKKNFIIRDVVTYNINPSGYDLFSNLEISSQLLSAFPTENISIDQCFYSPSIGDTPDYIYRITATKKTGQLSIFSSTGTFYYFDRNGNNICSANSNLYKYETFGSLIQDREYLIKFRVINSSSGRVNITHTFNLQKNESYTLPYTSSNGNSIGFTSTGFYSAATTVSNYVLSKGETVEISCTLI